MPYYGQGPLRVHQAGRYDMCAKAQCGKHSQYRLIMSSHDVQVYVCTTHLAWGVNLDCHRDTEWRAMGARPNTTRAAGVQVIPEMGPIRRLDFSRPLDLAPTYPIPSEPHYFGDSGLPEYLPTYSERAS